MLMRLSQGQLNALEKCPRKFQYLYLDRLGSPVTSEQQTRLTWGNQFHLLMQQRELGLPINVLVQEDDPLQNCIQAFVKAAPDLFRPVAKQFRQSEHRRTLEFQDYLLTVIYDLLILEEDQAQILDWKTYPRPQNRQWLAQDWQTRLYPFVLAETSHYLPEQISMTYWFVRSAQGEAIAPQNLKFTYSAQQHEQNRQDLTALLKELTAGLASYAAGQPFPKAKHGNDLCEVCSFEARCQQDALTQSASGAHLPDLADIEEIALEENPYGPGAER